MRPALLMLRHSWRQSAAALAIFLLGWHTLTIWTLTRHLEDKFAAMALQSTPDIDLALRRGDILGLRNTVGRLAIEGVSGVRFDPTPDNGRIPPVIVGFPFNSVRLKIGANRTLNFSGAALGSVSYSAGLAHLNAIAVRENASLYFAVSAFMVAVMLLASLGTLRSLARIEDNLSSFLSKGGPPRLEDLKAHLRERAGDEEADPVTRSLFQLLQRHILAVEQAGHFEAEAEASKKMAALASQVAHDIRSPLAALKAGLGGTLRKDESQASVMQGAASRIEEIANDLLARYRHERVLPGLSTHLSGAPATEQDAVPLVEGVVAERRAASPEADLRFERGGDGPAWIRVGRGEFARALSNIVGNALEAVGPRGLVRLTLINKGGEVAICVADDGPGIAPGVLSKLARPGFTSGKAGGSGLGLAHAKVALESWGGRLEIESELGRGTSVRLILPRVETPPPTQDAGTAVLIDDDPLVRMNWTVAAKRAGNALKVYPDAASFIKEAGDCARDTPIFIDSDLGKGVKGEEAAKELLALGFTELSLATGHDPASFPPLPHIKAIRGKEPPWPTSA